MEHVAAAKIQLAWFAYTVLRQEAARRIQAFYRSAPALSSRKAVHFCVVVSFGRPFPCSFSYEDSRVVEEEKYCPFHENDHKREH